MAELSKKDKDLLAELYEADVYKPLKKLLEIERFNIATKLLSLPATDITQIARMQGQAEALKNLNLQIKQLYKDLPKD